MDDDLGLGLNVVELRGSVQERARQLIARVDGLALQGRGGFADKATPYQDVVTMTRTTGWKA